MNILVTGASGLLGAHIVSRFACAHNVTGVDRNPWWGERCIQFFQGDLSESAFLRDIILRSSPDVLIHSAGMIDVDGCENNPDQALQSNVEITSTLVENTPPQCKFVYISTDAVFSGASSFWQETDEPKPLNVYARTKFEGERATVKASTHLILRTNFYGWSSGRKKTAAEWLHQALRDGEPINLFDDFFTTPIYAADLARCLEATVNSGYRGLLHLAGRDRVSKYEFGLAMGRLMGVSMSNVRRGSLAEAKFAAPRAKDISLGTERARALLGFEMPGCEQGLRRFLSDQAKPLSQR